MPHIVKHICNSHNPTRDQKLQKSLPVFQRFFCRPEKQNRDSSKIENEVIL